MQVKHRLPRTRADVKHGPVAIVDAALPCDIGSNQLASADQFGILSYGFLQAANMLFGNDQHVGRSLRIDIVEGVGMFVFVDFLGGYFPANDAAEQAIVHDTSIVWDWRRAALQRGCRPTGEARAYYI